MGTRFDTWLSRPLTLCFPARLLHSTGPRPVPLRQQRHGSTASGGDGDGRRVGDGRWRRRYYRSEQIRQDPTSASRKKAEAAENAFRIALGPEAPSTISDRTSVFRSLRQDMDMTSSTSNLVQHLVESPFHTTTDLKLWTALLQHTHRRDGLPGVITVWQALRKNAIDLPACGEDADILWTTFITSGILKRKVKPGRSREDEEILFPEVLQYAARLKDRSGVVYHKLYQTVVGTWLRINPYLAPKWHRHLAEHIGDDYVDVISLVDYCATSASLKAFKTIYLEDGKHNLYSHCIPELLTSLGVEETLKWHQLFIRNGDGPSDEVFAMPLVQKLFEKDGNRSLPMVHRRLTNNKDFIVPKDGIPLDFPSLTRATMSTLVGEVHGIKQREVSDSFVAKMLATRAFPLDMIVSGLGMLGIEKLGPLALREMALRAESASKLDKQLVALRRLEIVVSESVYCQLLLKLAKEEPHGLYGVLLASDQHPDEFEDVRTQEKLLAKFLEQEDLNSAQITLIGLSLKGGLTQAKAWNHLLQHYIKKHEYRPVAQTVKQMQAHDMILTQSTLTLMHHHLLPRRSPGKAPPDPMLDMYLGVAPLQFTINAYMYTAERGVSVSPKLWIEIMKRLGMLQKWNELERLVHWLATFYQDWKRTVFKNERRAGRKVRVNMTLRTIFSPAMREALIVWGFRSAADSKLLFEAKSEHCQPWARGLFLLQKLNNSGLHNTGQQTSPDFVRKVLKLRMWILFGPAYSTRHINQEAKIHNKLSLAHYLQHANAIWKGQLFDLDPKLYEPQNHPRLLVALFGTKKRVSQKTGDKADVVAYARALAEGRPMPNAFSRSGSRRERIWRWSPFNILPAGKLNATPNLRPRTPTALKQQCEPLTQQHRQPSAHSSNSHPVANHLNTREPA